MTTTQEHRNEDHLLQEDLLEGFCAVQTKAELLEFLNKAQVIVYGEEARTITKRSFNYYAYSSNAKQRYISFQIPKKDGSSRTIDAPCKSLKVIQKALSVLLESIYAPNASVMGFVNGRSIVDNAKAHLGKQYVYNIDLKNFFPSITAGRICARLQAKPYELKKKTASLIADICCRKNDDGEAVLPQGAPTSPIVTNIVCEKLDYKLQNLAKAFHLTYTRYADDITFSGNKNVFRVDGKFCQKLRHIIEEEEHFKINENKTRLCQRGGRMEVTGLTVNSKLNTSRKYMRQIRTMLHNWETMGYDKAQEIFLGAYNKTNTKNHNAKGVHHIENILAGKMMFMAMVKGTDDAAYKNLYGRFEKLVQSHFVSGANGDMSVSDILDVWENDGIEAAIELYEGSANSNTSDSNDTQGKVRNGKLDGQPISISDFFKEEEIEKWVSQKRKRKGAVVVCHGVVTKSGKKVFVSARLASEGFTAVDLKNEINNPTRSDISIIRFMSFNNKSDNTYYISYTTKQHKVNGDSINFPQDFIDSIPGIDNSDIDDFVAIIEGSQFSDNNI